MKDTLKPTLLVIDDDARVRMLFQTALESEGYRVLIAENGQHSLNLLSHCTVDVILANGQMRERDGLELIPRLRAAQPASRIIALSEGAGASRSLSRAKALGADHILQKPCSPDALLEAIGMQLKSVALK